jgi:hypothetical protein
VETFVIQLPTQPKTLAELCRPEVRGAIEHVGSGRRRVFADACELLAFLRAGYACPAERAE